MGKRGSGGVDTSAPTHTRERSQRHYIVAGRWTRRKRPPAEDWRHTTRVFTQGTALDPDKERRADTCSNGDEP